MYLQNGEYQNAKYDLDEAILIDPEIGILLPKGSSKYEIVIFKNIAGRMNMLLTIFRAQ